MDSIVSGTLDPDRISPSNTFSKMSFFKLNPYKGILK